jgi:hypothetical protein
METNGFKVKYNDKILFPVLIIIMSGINLFIVYPTALSERPVQFVRALTGDSIEVIICWLLMRKLILFFDQTMPYPGQIVKRIVLQLLTTISACVLLLILITIIVSLLNGHSSLPTEFYTHHIWVYAIWLLCHNAIYVIMYMNQWSKYLQAQSNMTAKSEPSFNDTPLHKRSLVIKLGNKSAIVDFDQIIYCTIESQTTLIYTHGGDCHLTDKSLDELETLLPEDLFFRANRQAIINRELITAIHRINNGKINVIINSKTNLSQPLVVSRTKASAFKAWFGEMSY